MIELADHKPGFLGLLNSGITLARQTVRSERDDDGVSPKSSLLRIDIEILGKFENVIMIDLTMIFFIFIQYIDTGPFESNP